VTELRPTLPPDEFQRAVLAWYDEMGRTLPFRGTTDPWAVLVSEVMAQQTQVSRVGPAWVVFMTRFPGAADLASATAADVLRAWAGLGYNRRALALRRCAQVVVGEHGGSLPSDVAALERLPGIGPYTARAVAAIAFGQPVAAVDTNIRRVIGRVVASDGATPSPVRLQALADELVPVDRPADWTHALMDVGSAFCRPRAPLCERCPARRWCATASDRPIRSVGARPHRPAKRPEPFEATSRWLRGRLVERLRDATDGAWVRFAGGLGRHDAGAVVRALEGLAREGMIERREGDPTFARLPSG
jgi:A/G-specific adenine glycosylase